MLERVQNGYVLEEGATLTEEQQQRFEEIKNYPAGFIPDYEAYILDGSMPSEFDEEDAKRIKEKVEELKKRKNHYETMKNKLEEAGENEISTTDTDARLMSNNNGSVEVAYNVQTAVDSKHKLIIAFDVINQANDLGCLSPLALQVKQFVECETIEMLADKGYYQTVCRPHDNVPMTMLSEEKPGLRRPHKIDEGLESSIISLKF